LLVERRVGGSYSGMRVPVNAPQYVAQRDPNRAACANADQQPVLGVLLDNGVKECGDVPANVGKWIDVGVALLEP
jgi:hypothetical protein